jgi:hypothetical protein
MQITPVLKASPSQQGYDLDRTLWADKQRWAGRKSHYRKQKVAIRFEYELENRGVADAHLI